MQYLGLLLVAVAMAVSACDDKSDAPQVEQSGATGGEEGGSTEKLTVG
jgi:hypothetical protein